MEVNQIESIIKQKSERLKESANYSGALAENPKLNMLGVSSYMQNNVLVKVYHQDFMYSNSGPISEHYREC
jgi:hypothetical protein